MTEHVKVYTGTSILTNRLAYLLDLIKIPTLIKDSKESGRLAGFGTTGYSSELFIFKSDFESANDTIQNFRKEIEK